MTTLKDLADKTKGSKAISTQTKERGFVTYVKEINPLTNKPRTLNAEIEVSKGQKYWIIYEKKDKKTEERVL